MSCAKCHQSAPSGNDTWCIGCTGWEALESELKGRWHSAAVRSLANDQVVSAVKHIRALRLYSANVKSAEDSRAARASAEKRVSLERDDRAPLPRSRDVEARGSVKEGRLRRVRGGESRELPPPVLSRQE